MRARIPVTTEGDGHFTLKMSPAQASLAGECLDLATQGSWGESYVEFCLGATREATVEIDEKLTSCASVNHRSEISFTLQQLHVIQCSLTSAVVEFTSDEDFHLRTGWYRENAIAFARELSRSLRGLLPVETAR